MDNRSTIKYVVAAIVIAIIGILAFKLVVSEDNSVKPEESEEVTVHPDWLTQTTTDGRIFSYPADLGMKYIRTQDWPPVLTVTNESFTCVLSGAEIEPAGVTEALTINGHDYCVTRVTEGAAGSAYTQYGYARSAGVMTEVLTFTIKSVQCGNYNEPEMNDCVAEQASFDVDSLVDDIFQTLK